MLGTVAGSSASVQGNRTSFITILHFPEGADLQFLPAFFFSSKLWHKTWYTILSHSLEWQKCSQFQENNLDFKNDVNVGKNYIFCIYNVQRNSLPAIKLHIKCLRKKLFRTENNQGNNIMNKTSNFIEFYVSNLVKKKMK